MSRIKLISLAVFAAVMTGALAAPVVASASEWLDEGQPLEKAKTVDFEGRIWSRLPWVDYRPGWKNCLFQGKATLYPGGLGETTEYHVVYESCEETMEQMLCEVVYDENEPMGLVAEEGQVGITSFNFKFKTNPQCGSGFNGQPYWPTWYVTPQFEEEVMLTPDDPEHISSLSSGIFNAHLIEPVLQGETAETQLYNFSLGTGEIGVG